MCFPVFGHMKKTADNTDAGFQPAQLVAVLPAAKPAAQPLWRCQNYSLNQKATLSRGCEGREFTRALSKTEGLAKQVRATRGQRRVAQPMAASALSAVFQNVFCGNPIIHNLGAKPNSAEKVLPDFLKF